MDHLAKLVAALSLALAPTAYAGYAQLKPPSGWSAGTSAGATYGAAANEAWVSQTVRTNASLNVAGRTVAVPASMRMAANAPRVAAAVLFLSPHLRLGLGIAAWLGVGKIVWDEADKAWKETTQKIDGSIYEYSVQVDPSQQWFPNQNAACQRAVQIMSTGASGGYSLSVGACEYPTVTIKRTHPVYGEDYFYRSLQRREVTNPGECPVGWTPSGAGCLSPALTQPQFVEKLAPPAPATPSMPNTVPPELPHSTPWPVERPVINPSPGVNPSPQPLFVPTGNPVPNPNYNPNQAPSPANQPYLQPGVRVVPTPTPQNPWQVDVQPVDKPTPSPNPDPEPKPEDPEDPNKPENKEGDLCEKNPEILACQKVVLKDLDAKPVPNADKTLAITPDTGWGPSGGTCPPPRTAVVMGKTLTMPFTMLCDFATAIKPLFIALAWLSAALTFFGIGRKD